MTALGKDLPAFKMAVIFSVTVHVALFLLILFSPHLPATSNKEMIHYVNVITFAGEGGGGPGGGGEKVVETPLPKRQTLKDLTTLSKLMQEPASSLRHPVAKPKKEAKPKPEKAASIQKEQKAAEAAEATAAEEGTGSAAGTGGGSGSGIRIGGGGGAGTEPGFSSAFSSQIGLSNFPFTYYLQIIIDKVSSNWFTSLIDAGISGKFHATVYFKINRDGKISDIKIQESSGIESLDMSALRAVQSSSFPPLPRDYEGEFLAIFLIFEHSK
jgi:TonB family protein